MQLCNCWEIIETHIRWDSCERCFIGTHMRWGKVWIMKGNGVIIEYGHSHEVRIDAWETYEIDEKIMSNF